MMSRSIFTLALALTMADPAVVKEITDFRAKHETDYRRDYVTLAGLFALKDGVNTAGSAASNDIVLPKPAAATIGRFVVSAGRVRFEPAPGSSVTVKDQPITKPIDLTSDENGPGDQVTIAPGKTVWVHMSGDRPSIRLRDKNSKLRTQFVGTSWFPVNTAYRVEAAFEPYAKPKTIQVPNILGDIDAMPVPGIVSFTLNGQQITMEPVAEAGDKEFWFIFRDLTSGKATYPAARFLYMPAPVNGKMIVDFNRAENPPCAYNPYATCPLPPEQNRLRLKIEAGEKNYAGHS